MALSQQDLAAIDALLAAPDADASALTALRQRLPKLTLTRCDASDIDAETPFRAFARFTVYLVDGADHCWTLTTDPDRATGLVVVQHKVPA
jgi:hypothetical protein